MDQLLSAGVDGIFSNHTALLRDRVDALVGSRREEAASASSTGARVSRGP